MCKLASGDTSRTQQWCVNYTPALNDVLFMHDKKPFVMYESPPPLLPTLPSTSNPSALLASNAHSLLSYCSLYCIFHSLRSPTLLSPCQWSPQYHADVKSTKISETKEFLAQAALRHFEPLRCFARRYSLTSLFSLNLQPQEKSCGLKCDAAGVRPQFRASVLQNPFTLQQNASSWVLRGTQRERKWQMMRYCKVKIEQIKTGKRTGW